jgi:hypothetical protein
MLLIIGATLPWLTLDGGLQRYSGTIGFYGWLIVAAGALALAIGLLGIRKRFLWLPAATTVLGLGLLAFAMWLLTALQQVVHRPEDAMFAPSAGPGIYVVFAGAILIVSSAVAHEIFRWAVSRQRTG